jgi:hypothetical protein
VKLKAVAWIDSLEQIIPEVLFSGDGLNKTGNIKCDSRFLENIK